MAAMEWDGKTSAAQNASERLPAAAREYFAAGRELAANGKPAAEAMHAFRLRTKRFRYMLEMFKDVYGDGLDEYLGVLRKVQNYLGEINDCATTRALVLEALPSPSAQRRRIERELDARMEERTKEFLDCWRSELGTEAEEARWCAFLAPTPAGEPGKPAAAGKPAVNRAIPA